MPEVHPARTELDRATLERVATPARGHTPVISIYADLDPHDFPTPAARATEIDALLGAAHRSPGARRLGADGQAQLRGLGDALHEHAERGRAVAGFAHEGAPVETVPLNRSVEPEARVAMLPHLLPLLAATAADRWCAALVTRRTGRLLLGDGFTLEEVGRIDDTVHRRHSGGGWAALAQSRFQRSIEHDVEAHYRRTADALASLHRRRPFDRLLVAGNDGTLGAMNDALDPALRALLDGGLRVDLEHARPSEVLDHARSAIRGDEEERERAALAGLADDVGVGRAAAGVDDTLAALRDRRADTLFVAEALIRPAWCCARCDWIAGSPGACPEHPDDAEPCDAADAALVAGVGQGLDVVVVRYLRDELEARGGLAATLRY